MNMHNVLSKNIKEDMVLLAHQFYLFKQPWKKKKREIVENNHKKIFVFKVQHMFQKIKKIAMLRIVFQKSVTQNTIHL